MPGTERRSVRYSQNFLHDARLVSYLLAGSSIRREDTVYDIGPGKGIITRELARHCDHIVAVEKDPILAQGLKHDLRSLPGVEVVEADFLELTLPSTPYKVFANIPFNVTADIVSKLTSAPNPPDDTYLVMQAEAAKKYLGLPRETLYSVLLKPWFLGSQYHRFLRSDFHPVPQVDVVMLRLSEREPSLIEASDAQLYRDFVVYGYTAWKPSLRHAYLAIFTPEQVGRIRTQLGIDLDVAPTELPFEQWLVLFYYLKLSAGRRARQVVAGAEERLRLQQQGLQKRHRTPIRPAHPRRGRQAARRSAATGQPRRTPER
ncbi:MAG: 23S ribosomal RNA methyltransferase Erm [Chloroflexota bacterium]|nr:23S ribosomal RNA methyltransferase Erm [Chloroflexota bacterium]